MKIHNFIEQRFKERLTQFPCLAIYAPEQCYREIARSLAGDRAAPEKRRCDICDFLGMSVLEHTIASKAIGAEGW